MGTTDTGLYPTASDPATPFSFQNGVNYSRDADITKVTKKQAKADLKLISSYASMIRVFDWNSYVMDEAKSLGMEVALGTNNGTITQFSSNTGISDFVTQITPYKDIIKIIAIGNEVFFNGYNVADVVSAIQNLNTALIAAGLTIQVTTDVIWAKVGASSSASGYNPKDGTLTANGETLLAALHTLYGKNAILLASFYPFLDLTQWPANLQTQLLPYVLFQKPSLGPCSNQFDSDYSTLRYAMKAGGYSDVTVVVSETGWPTENYSTYASATNANNYLSGYENWQAINSIGLTTFWFEMFDEPQKTVAPYDSSWGLLNSDSTAKIGLTVPDWTNPIKTTSAA